eukprot:3717588-Amphidinium_carterae.1
MERDHFRNCPRFPHGHHSQSARVVKGVDLRSTAVKSRAPAPQTSWHQKDPRARKTGDGDNIGGTGSSIRHSSSNLSS